MTPEKIEVAKTLLAKYAAEFMEKSLSGLNQLHVPMADAEELLKRTLIDMRLSLPKSQEEIGAPHA